MNTPKAIGKLGLPVIKNIINSSRCIGCGGCLDKGDTMEINSEGLYQPKFVDNIKLKGKEKVCPFNSSVDIENNRTKLQPKDNNTNYHNYLGHYSNLYAGYSLDHRGTSSSGGLSTWILEQLLKNGHVEKIICVSSSDDGYYQYKIIDNVKELQGASHTKYYPVTLNKVLEEVAISNNTYAFVGLPCFVHAIKLREQVDQRITNKIKFKIGLFCGGYKTKFFTEYLSSLCDVSKENIIAPKYREKKSEGVATDYLFSVNDRASYQKKYIPMNKVGDMWGTGLFKPEVCDYCEDISSDLADVSIGDAWIPPYSNSPEGHNVLICRNKTIQNLLSTGISENKLNLDIITEKQILSSQKGNITHRIIGLAHRLSLTKALDENRLVTKSSVTLNITVNLVQFQRNKVRKLSLEEWPKCKSHHEFDKLMEPHLRRLKLFTKINHIYRKINLRTFMRKLKEKFSSFKS